MEVLDIINTNDTFASSKEKLKELGLVIKEYPELDLYLVKYDKQKTDMNNATARKCRGLIARISDNKLVCFPPAKSVDITSVYNSIEQWNSLSIEEFVDGTMINLFYHHEQWLISTRSNIGANCNWLSNKNFSTMFEEACKLDIETLDKGIFYTFVLMHPENIIVTKYIIPDIVLVSMGTVEDNIYKNLDIYSANIDIKKPIVYNFNNIQEIKRFVGKMDYQQQGIIIKNSYNLRTKIRNPNYNYVKSLKGNTNNLKYLYYENKKKKTIQEYLSFFPDETDMYNKFHQEFIKLIRDLHNFYKQYHIKRSISITKMPFQLRPLCYELHNIHKTQRKIITFDIIYNYITNLDSGRIVYILKNKPDCDMSYN